MFPLPFWNLLLTQKESPLEGTDSMRTILSSNATHSLPNCPKRKSQLILQLTKTLNNLALGISPLISQATLLQTHWNAECQGPSIKLCSSLLFFFRKLFSTPFLISAQRSNLDLSVTLARFLTRSSHSWLAGPPPGLTAAGAYSYHSIYHTILGMDRMFLFLHPKFIYWNPNPEHDGIWRWGLWGVIRFRWSPEGRGPMLGSMHLQNN